MCCNANPERREFKIFLTTNSDWEKVMIFTTLCLMALTWRHTVLFGSKAIIGILSSWVEVINLERREPGD